MPTLEQGRIVLADVLDLQNRNRKRRPLLIVTPTAEIRDDEPFFAVAITGTLPKVLPPDHVLLPYHRQGHPRTKLRKRSAAVCRWLVELRHDDVVEIQGMAPTKELAKIIAILESAEEQ